MSVVSEIKQELDVIDARGEGCGVTLLEALVFKFNTYIDNVKPLIKLEAENASLREELNELKTLLAEYTETNSPNLEEPTITTA